MPDEWNITGAQLTGPDGEVIADFSHSNLHVVGYSEPVDIMLSLEDLQEHLYSRPDLPEEMCIRDRGGGAHVGRNARRALSA